MRYTTLVIVFATILFLMWLGTGYLMAWSFGTEEDRHIFIEFGKNMGIVGSTCFLLIEIVEALRIKKLIYIPKIFQ